MASRHVSAAALLLALLCSASQTRAESPYELDWAIDLPVVGISTAMAMAAFVELEPPSCLPTCSADGINDFDRVALGKYSPGARKAADVGVVALLALPVALDAVDSGGEGWLEDSFVFGETILLTQGLTQLTKLAVRRKAPFVYDESVPIEVRRDSPDASRAFWSGHAATAFAAATVASVTYWHRHPDSPWRWVVLGLSGAAATTVSVLKFEAGYHYPTDLLAGAAVGTGMGVLVPELHRW